jgi:chemotaxis protein histidine kinase CheA
VRRAFHTLKGSGRMVGATDISEFAWSIENLLNKIIENTLQRSPSILATIRDASAIAGELVNALEAGQGAPAKVQDIIDRAHALAANRASPGAQTATMEILERTLETRRDDLSATNRVPTRRHPWNQHPAVAGVRLGAWVRAHRCAESGGNRAFPADETQRRRAAAVSTAAKRR